MIPAPVGHHCPECVREARRAFRLGPARRARTIAGLSATNILLLAIVAMFVVEILVSRGRILGIGLPNKTAFDLGALFPPAIAGIGPFHTHQYWRLVTAMFLHASLIHIALNGWALYLFGQFVEEWFGRARFFLIYFVTGFLASVASYAFGPVRELGVGASGAIVGLLGAFIAYNLRRWQLPMSRAHLRWAAIIIAINAIFGAAFAGIDNWAHGGGLVAGLFAGTFAEGVGPRPVHAVSRVLGFVVLIAVGVALTVWRTSTLS
jgi:membrane associated rhomboid family serine protease